MLLAVAEENSTAVMSAVESELISWVASSKDEEAEAGVLYVLKVPAIINQENRVRLDRDIEARWLDMYRTVCGAIQGHMLYQAQRSRRVALQAWNKGIISIDKLVEWHGLAPFFAGPSHPLEEDYYYPTAPVLSRLGLSAGRGIGNKRLLNDIRRIGQLLLAENPPWIAPSVFSSMLPRARDLFGDWRVTKGIKDKDRIWGAICLSACYVELEQDSERWIPRKTTGEVNEIQIALLGRMSKERIAASLGAIDALKLDGRQAALLRRWARREVNFVEPGQESPLVPALNSQ